MEAKKIVDALNQALREEMDRDERVVLLGEDIGVFQGAYRVTEGLLERYGEERVKDTPISEIAIIGAAIGAAMTGLRPVAEIQFNDFLACGMDQLCNQAAKARFMLGGQVKVPMVVRAPYGATGRAAQHSQSLEAWFVHTPGLKVVMPSTPYDAYGLLKASIRDDHPVIYIEHKLLYMTKGEVPEEDYLIALGEADVRKTGEDVTLLTYSYMALKCLEAAELLEKEDISVEDCSSPPVVCFSWYRFFGGDLL